jgi:hypothetical protein
VIDRMINYDDYLADETLSARREAIYHKEKRR